MRVLVVLLLVSLAAGSVQAKTPPPPTPASPGALCRPAIAAAERSWRLPGGLLPAIARVESGRPDPRTGVVQLWPWTINAEGVGRFFDTKEQAIAAVLALQARGVRSIDVGCMQVNLLHHPFAFSSLEEAFDPLSNALYAGRFLAALYGQLASWPVAAAAYHSQTPELGAEYRRRVMIAWGRPEALATNDSGSLPARSVAYGDFAAQQTAYRAFAAPVQVYGAFAPGSPPPSSRARHAPAVRVPASAGKKSQVASLR